MERKYLPIGSVCSLKGKNKKVMIIGYYSPELKGNLKINDYVGCAYPEGMLISESFCSFNHTDIENVDFLGFKNDEQRTFEGLLNRLTGNDEDEVERAAEFHKENDMYLTSNKTYSKLLFDSNGVVMIADPVVEEKNTLNNIEFDENGYVISAQTTEKIENPFYKEYEQQPIKDNINSEWNIFKNIEFDENGTVVDVTANSENKKVSDYKFDEEGNVITEKTYEFDASGNLVSIDSKEKEEEVPPIGPGLPGYVKPENKKVSSYNFDEEGNVTTEKTYEFDASGNLVSVDSKEKEEEVPPIGPGLPGYVEPKKVNHSYLDDIEALEEDSIRDVYKFNDADLDLNN